MRSDTTQVKYGIPGIGKYVGLFDNRGHSHWTVDHHFPCVREPFWEYPSISDTSINIAGCILACIPNHSCWAWVFSQYGLFVPLCFSDEIKLFCWSDTYYILLRCKKYRKIRIYILITSRYLLRYLYLLPICSMVLEYLPTFAQHKSPSHVGKYTIHGASGYAKIS